MDVAECTGGALDGKYDDGKYGEAGAKSGAGFLSHEERRFSAVAPTAA